MGARESEFYVGIQLVGSATGDWCVIPGEISL